MRTRRLDIRARLPRRAALVALCAALGALLAIPAGAGAQGSPNVLVRDLGTTHGLKAELQNNDGGAVETLQLTLQQSGFFFSKREGPGNFPDDIHLDGAIGSCFVTPVGVGVSNSIICTFGAPNYWPSVGQIVIRGFDVSSDAVNPGDGNAYPDAGRGNLVKCLQPCTDPGQVRGPHTVFGPGENGIPVGPPGGGRGTPPGSNDLPPGVQGTRSIPATGQVFVAIQVGEAGVLNATAQALLFLAGELPDRPFAAVESRSHATATAKGKKGKKGKKPRKRKVTVAEATANPTGPGVVEIGLRPNKRGMKVLRRTGKLNAELTVDFTPASGGPASSLTSKITFRLDKGKKKKKNKKKK